jgi:hypothetical protein
VGGHTELGRGGTWAFTGNAPSPNAAWRAPSVADVFPEPRTLRRIQRRRRRRGLLSMAMGKNKSSSTKVVFSRPWRGKYLSPSKYTPKHQRTPSVLPSSHCTTRSRRGRSWLHLHCAALHKYATALLFISAVSLLRRRRATVQQRQYFRTVRKVHNITVAAAVAARRPVQRRCIGSMQPAERKRGDAVVPQSRRCSCHPSCQKPELTTYRLNYYNVQDEDLRADGFDPGLSPPTLALPERPRDA